LVDVEEVIDRLYALPPSDFTEARNATVRELRKAGLRSEATYVGEQRKPTDAAGAVNRLVRTCRSDVEQFLHAAAALRDSQLSGAADVQTAARREREALTRLVRVGGGEVRQSLQAAAVDRVAAERLLAGRLVQELEPAGFGTLLEDAKPSAAKRPARSAPTPPVKTAVKPRAKRDDRAAQERLSDARKGYIAARAELRSAERSWNRARENLARAEVAVEKAQASLERIRNG
jgi:hypothetical protein